MTTFKPEYEVVRPGVELWPEHFTFDNYLHVLFETKIGYWYLNSLITSGAVTVIVVGDGRRRGLCDLAARISRPAACSGG